MFRNYINIVLLFAAFTAALFAQNSGDKKVEITYKSTDNIREIAEKYLGDPDLWQEILYSSNLTNANQLEDGIKLTLYPQKIIKANKTRLEAKEKIESATKAGARVFATALINNAINEMNNGLADRKSGAWDAALSKFKKSIDLSDKAIEKVNKERIVDTEALVSFRKGKVEKKASRERVWLNAPVKTKLATEDRARTLTNSYAEISFQDDSKIRLNENSLAVIKKSKADLLSQKKENSVKLIKGDAFALFSKSSKKKNELEVPGVKVNVKSSFFWVEKKEKATKFANYEGELEVSAKNKTVNLAKNQGSIVPAGGVPSDPIDLLPPPETEQPANGTKIYDSKFNVIWKSVNGAQNYFLIISKDANRQKVVRNFKRVKGTQKEIQNLEPGSYYWFVASVDKYGFPGQMSDGRSFTVIKDDEAPYLIVKAPENNIVSQAGSIEFNIEIEQDLQLSINDQIVEFTGKSVKKIIDLQDGYNKVIIKAVDKAGNSTTVEREIYYEKDSKVSVQFDASLKGPEKGSFYTNSNTFILAGFTRPDSRIELTDNAGLRLSSYSDKSGKFRFLLNNITEDKTITLKVVTPGQHEHTENIKILYDGSKPELTFSSEIPDVTNTQVVKLAGTLAGSESLMLNGENLVLSGGTFDTDYTLKYGANKLVFTTSDKAGNKSSETKYIRLDNLPPAMIKYDISKKSSGWFVIYTITINAEDDSQLRKAAQIKVFTDSGVLNKFINLSGDGKTYRGDVKVPAGKVTKSVGFEAEITDYLGNGKSYKLK